MIPRTLSSTATAVPAVSESIEPATSPALWLVRHGESTWNIAGICQGHNDDAELTERARAALDSHRRSLASAAHREIDALCGVGTIDAHRAEVLKRLLTAEAVERHDQDGMSLSDIIDMYRDLTE